MFSKTLFPTIVALACVLRVSSLPQVTTTLPFGVVDPLLGGDGNERTISGVIIGTGGGETTYVFSQTATGDGEIPTFTVIENASEGRMIQTFSSDGVEATIRLGCEFGSDGEGTCTQEVVGASDGSEFTETMTTTGSVQLQPVVFSTRSGNSNPTETGTSPASSSDQPSSAEKPIAADLSGVISVALAVLALA